MKILYGRIVAVRSTEQSVGHPLTPTSYEKTIVKYEITKIKY